MSNGVGLGGKHSFQETYGNKKMPDTSNESQYSKLFNFFYMEHNLELLEGEIEEIVSEVQKFLKEYNEPVNY